MVGKAEEIPIICLRPCRRVFKLKSQTPRSLSFFACLKVHAEVKAPTSPLFPLTSCSPMCLGAAENPDLPEGLTSFPEHIARTHTHRPTRVAFVHAAGVATHKHTVHATTRRTSQTTLVFSALLLFQEQQRGASLTPAYAACFPTSKKIQMWWKQQKNLLMLIGRKSPVLPSNVNVNGYWGGKPRLTADRKKLNVQNLSAPYFQPVIIVMWYWMEQNKSRNLFFFCSAGGRSEENL